MKVELVKKRTSCRLCDCKRLQLVLPMKPSPIGDAFVPFEEKDKFQNLIPLDLYQCQECGHAQNVDIVNPEELFRDYLFTTASSSGLVKHFQIFARNVLDQLAIPKNSLVVEIGSNDGTLLRFFKNLGMNVVGVDPAREIARQASSAGIPTLCAFFSSVVANEVRKEHGTAQLIVANNVYAHIDELADITEGIASLLDNDGVFVFEVSYLLDIIDHFVFDTIYHEHLSYHSIEPLVRFFHRHHLELIDVQKVSTKGGSMRCFVQKFNGPRNKSATVDQWIHEEESRGLHRPEIFQHYAMQIQQRKEALDHFLTEAHDQGKHVAGYGASTTATTLMYQFNLEKRLGYLIDDNPKKQGMFSPGCHLEVKPSSVLYSDRPDIVVILAWQYADPILQKHVRFVEENGTFVVPLPVLKIFSKVEAMNEYCCPS